MNARRILSGLFILVLLWGLLAGSGLAQGTVPEGESHVQDALGTAFSYQGQLTQNGSPVSGECSLAFRLYDQANEGAQVGSPITRTILITDGIFTVALDFGASVFTGDARWLGILVQCSDDTAYTDLGRQALTAAPYALYAARAPWSGLLGVPAGFADGEDDVSLVVSGTNILMGEGLGQVSSGNAITLSVSPSYRLPQMCANGQITEWDGALWVCGDDETGNNDHNHLGQTWTGDANSLVITGTFDQVDDPAPLVLGNTAPYGEGLWVRSEGGDGVAVGRADDAGVRVWSAGGAGVAVNWAGDASAAIFSPHNDGFQVAGAAGNGLYVGRADLNGVDVYSAGWDGMHVYSASLDGVRVGSAGLDGVYVGQAGNPTTTVRSDYPNGFEVAGAEGYGLYVGRADRTGVVVDAAGADGVYVGRAGSPSAVTPSEYANGVEVAGAEGYGLYVGRTDYGGVRVVSAGGDGVAVDSASGDGYYVAQASARGLGVGITGGDGVYVHQAGAPSSRTSSPQPNGFEVAGAEGYGLYVGQADLDGVYVNSTAWHGVNVNGAGVNGVYVTNAGNYGVAVDSAGAGGVYGHSANGPGLRGESDQNDGIVGWTGSGSKSGVFGYSQTGNGVAGISDGQYGVLAITTSSDPNEAALLAHNQGAGPAVEAQGDLVVTGAYRGNIGPNGGASFPRPAYNSGWVALDYGESVTLTHNIGGNPEDYVIDMTRRCAYTGVSNIGDGGDMLDFGDVTGYKWSQLNGATIEIRRGNNDYSCGAYPMQFRVRIWVYR